MRNPGDRSADRMPGRWKGAGGRSAVSGPPAGADGQPAPAGSSLFVPGYAGDRPPTGDTGRQAAVRTSGGRAGAMAGTAAKGPVRGFPPAPGQPPPVYPPGQFSAWNRAARPAADGLLDGGQAADGWVVPDYSEPASHDSAAPWPPEPGYADSGYDGPGYGAAGYGAAGYSGPGYSEPGRGEPDYGDPGHGDPGYSVLAVSDPTADVTTTQSWEAVDAPRTTEGRADPGALAEPPQAGPAGQTEHAPGQTSQADRADTGRTGRARSDTGGHRLQGPRPGSSGPARDAGRLPEPAAGAGSRPDRPRADRPPARRAHARTRRAKRPGRVLLACGLVLALVAGGAAYFWLSSGHQGAGQAAAAPKPSARTPRQSQTATPSPSPSLGPWGHIETRAADPLALTLAELFPGNVSAGGSTYARTVERDGTNCAKAVIGAALQSAVKHGKCSQVMRASYLSGTSQVMGTIGVLNLISVTAAEKSGKAAGGGDFIDQLPAAKGPTRHLTKGTGLEETEIKGHYLVMVWAEFANLHAPKTKGQRLELEAFCNRLIQNTANLSLASRLVTGKPRVP
jgi:hypothetical protein